MQSDILNMAEKEIINRLRVIMADKNLTNQNLADKMGVSEITVSRWRTNTIQPSINQFIQIAHLLKVDIKDLLEDKFEYEQRARNE